MYKILKNTIYFGTLGALAAGAFLGLAGEGLGFGAFTALVTAVVSLATVFVARFALRTPSTTSASLTLLLAAGTFGRALVFPVSIGCSASLVGLAALGAADAFVAVAFLTGTLRGLSAALAFLGTAAFLGAGLATSVLSSTSALKLN